VNPSNNAFDDDNEVWQQISERQMCLRVRELAEVGLAAVGVGEGCV
jgi:hypothetical protein